MEKRTRISARRFAFALVAISVAGTGVTAELPRLILSEVMADPAAVPDAQGEFLELANPSGEPAQWDSVVLTVDASDFALGAVRLGANGFLLLCRDTSRISNGGLICNRPLPGLSLANSRAIAISLAYPGYRADYALPAAKSGVSWENTFELDAGYQRFLPSAGIWGADSATPGFRNSRSIQPAQHDLGITGVTWAGDGGGKSIAGLSGALLVTIENRGLGAIPSSYMTVRLDADWDGQAETLLDSIPIDAARFGGGAIMSASLRISLGSRSRGILRFHLGPDEYPGNNDYQLLSEPTKALEITEWCPAPPVGGSEWIELRNSSGDQGGTPRNLDLSDVALNGMALGAGSLPPGGFLILAEDAAKFRAQYGALKVRLSVPTGWKTLRNTGDTLRLALAGMPLDSVVFTSKDAANGGTGGCFARGPAGSVLESADSGLAGLGASPGYAVQADSSFIWTLSEKIAGTSTPMDMEIGIPAPAGYHLRAFDLEGNCVHDFGGGGPGRHLLRWFGEGRGGAIVKPGPYVLCLSMDGRKAIKRAVIVSDR